jgi:hypothetical protein
MCKIRKLIYKLSFIDKSHIMEEESDSANTWRSPKGILVACRVGGETACSVAETATELCRFLTCDLLLFFLNMLFRKKTGLACAHDSLAHPFKGRKGRQPMDGVTRYACPTQCGGFEDRITPLNITSISAHACMALVVLIPGSPPPSMLQAQIARDVNTAHIYGRQYAT